MALNFPSAPNTGDIHTVGSIIWRYNGKAWDSLYEPSAPAQVGLSNVDNTSDEDKPVSTAQQAALDALTKDDVGLDNVDNTSDMNKPVSTAQQAAIDAAGGGGGSSFDQDLNTTDSPTFATLTTTDTIATDVYAVDVSATGTVTADQLRVVAPDGDSYQISIVNGGDTTLENDDGFVTLDGHDGVRLSRRGTDKVFVTSTSVQFAADSLPNVDQSYSSGTASKRWSTTFTKDLDATGTVTAGDVAAEGALFDSPTVGSHYVLNVQSNSARNFSVDGFGTVECKTIRPRINGSFNFGSTSARWKELFTNDLDASGTVTAGGFVGTPQTLTDASTITYDLASGHNAKVTITADRALALPTNLAEGASGVLTLTQDGVGGHALTLASGWFVSAGAAADIAALAANEQAQITWYAYAADKVNATILPLQ